MILPVWHAHPGDVAPYGRIKRQQILDLQAARPDIKIMMWDVLSGDFDINLKPEACLDKVLKHTQAGSVIVFHDSLKAYDRVKYALPRALEVWSKAGFEFCPLTP